MTDYQPKNIIITGGAGFIGSNVINYLVAKYPNINYINIDRLDYCSNLKNIQVSDHDNYKFYKSNINNRDFISNILVTHKVDTIINFAAQTHVDNSFCNNSTQFTEDNILSLHYFLETIRAYGKIQRFIHISTDEVYGEVDANHPGCHEKSLLNPTNPYAATKAGAEFLVRSYHTSFGIPIIITRGNNVYGPYQYPEKIIPKFIHQLARGEPMTIHGQGISRRTFIHVDDVSTAIETILYKGAIGDIYNIGTTNEYSVMEIAKIIFEQFHSTIRDIMRQPESSNPIPEFHDENIVYVQDRNFNDYRYAIDSSNLKKLGWKESIDFGEGIKSTVKWYLENLNHWDLA